MSQSNKILHLYLLTSVIVFLLLLATIPPSSGKLFTSSEEEMSGGSLYFFALAETPWIRGNEYPLTIGINVTHLEEKNERYGPGKTYGFVAIQLGFILKNENGKKVLSEKMDDDERYDTFEEGVTYKIWSIFVDISIKYESLSIILDCTYAPQSGWMDVIQTEGSKIGKIEIVDPPVNITSEIKTTKIMVSEVNSSSRLVGSTQYDHTSSFFSNPMVQALFVILVSFIAYLRLSKKSDQSI